MNPKIQEHHRSKPAYIYLRQSTPGQVLHHRESTERQYALREKARELGWSESLIRTLDQDLGKTGTEMTREDFKTLVVRFINTLTYFGLCGRRFGRSKLVHEFGQILTRELPFEGTRGVSSACDDAEHHPGFCASGFSSFCRMQHSSTAEDASQSNQTYEKNRSDNGKRRL